MNNQEAFNKVCAHLKKQGKKSATSNGRCLYAGPNDTACAVGCLLPRELGAQLDAFRPSVEGLLSGGYRETEQGKRVRALLGGISPDLLIELQYAHDYAPTPFWEELEPGLHNIARAYNLELPPELT